MKSVRFDRLLASSALGLALVLCSHVSHAQQKTDAELNAAIPAPQMPDLDNLKAKDFGVAAPAAAAKDSATPVSAPAPAATLAPASNVASDVADKMREIITGKLNHLVDRKVERAGIENFYKARNYVPIWLTNGAESDRAKAAIKYLAQVDTVGLEPSDYPAPDFKSAVTADSLAEAEIRLSDSVLTYARQAQIGRIHYTRVASDIQFDLNAPNLVDVLAKVSESNDVAATLDDYNPPQQEFKALREKLAEVRANGSAVAEKREASKPGENVKVSDGKTLRPGLKDERVIQLRKRLDIADKDNPLYDDAVRDAVKAFQTSVDLAADGNLGPNTIKALNGQTHQAKKPPANPIDTIIVNMERWRWMPRDLGNPHVIVNVPNYDLTLWNDGKVYWHTKIVAGQPAKATPMISAEMKFITVNPTWNVPPSIIENEYLPALQQDPEALDRIGLKIRQDPDGTVHIFQPPGAANALGRIRFNFPNKFLVYQHDTPDKYLFAKDERAYSHGCMRVQDPFVYGEKLLSLVDAKDNYTQARLEKMLGTNEININFPKPVWVHLTYQTAFVDEDGKLQFRKDVYGRDARMIALLKGNERKIADIAIERAPNTSARPVKLAPGMYGGNNYGPSGPSFFDMLFGPPRPRYMQQQRRTDNNGRYIVRQ